MINREIKDLVKNFKNVWCISDTHFYHENIGKYCNRPNNWFDLIINNWNKVVNSNDIVLHLGDFSFGNITHIKSIRERLNGEIYLIRGNHDRHSKKWFIDKNIKAVSPFEFKMGNKIFLFTHKARKNLKKNIINIHGHWHEKCPFIYVGKNGNINFNLSVEVINYTPIKINSIIKIVNENL